MIPEIEATEKEFVVEVYVFDAHHIPGSSIYYFKGYMGTILHTGDFRYNPSMIYENGILFPKELILTKYKI
jgi:DNA cross-link repair 1B protein